MPRYDTYYDTGRAAVEYSRSLVSGIPPRVSSDMIGFSPQGIKFIYTSLLSSQSTLDVTLCSRFPGVSRRNLEASMVRLVDEEQDQILVRLGSTSHSA